MKQGKRIIFGRKVQPVVATQHYRINNTLSVWLAPLLPHFYTQGDQKHFHMLNLKQFHSPH